MPVKAIDTKKAMNELIYAYMEVRGDSNINQLLLIPCVILDFLCIHPFQDGNGRISRLLSLLLLYKNGFDISKYVSFEQQINLSKQKYYKALRQSSIVDIKIIMTIFHLLKISYLHFTCVIKNLIKRFWQLKVEK